MARKGLSARGELKWMILANTIILTGTAGAQADGVDGMPGDVQGQPGRLLHLGALAHSLGRAVLLPQGAHQGSILLAKPALCDLQLPVFILQVRQKHHKLIPAQARRNTGQWIMFRLLEIIILELQVKLLAFLLDHQHGDIFSKTLQIRGARAPFPAGRFLVGIGPFLHRP